MLKYLISVQQRFIIKVIFKFLVLPIHLRSVSLFYLCSGGDTGLYYVVTVEEWNIFLLTIINTIICEQLASCKSGQGRYLARTVIVDVGS